MRPDALGSTRKLTPSRGLRLAGLITALLSVTPLAAIVIYSPVGGYWLPMSLTWLVTVGSMAGLCIAQPLDKANPLLWSLSAVVVMYVLHPAAIIFSGRLTAVYHDSFFIASTYEEALWLGSLAAVSLVLGYALRPLVIRRQLPLIESDRSWGTLASGLAWLTFFAAILGYSLFCFTSGISITEGFANGARRGAIVSSTAYLYLSPQLLGPSGMLFLYKSRAQKKFPAMALVTIALSIILFLPSGQRLVLLTSSVPVLMYWLHLHGRRFGGWSTFTAALIGLVLLVSLRDVGTQGAPSLEDTVSSTVTNPSGALTTLLTGADTEMVDGFALELQRVPDWIPYRPGWTLWAAMAAPVPSVLWPAKPTTADGILNFELLNVEHNNASVAYGFAGELYFDSGPTGVALGLFLFGVVTGLLADLRRRATGPLGGMIALSVLPLTVALLRGSLALILGRAFFTLGPVLLFALLVANRERQIQRRESTFGAAGVRGHARKSVISS